MSIGELIVGVAVVIVLIGILLTFTPLPPKDIKDLERWADRRKKPQ